MARPEAEPEDNLADRPSVLEGLDPETHLGDAINGRRRWMLRDVQTLDQAYGDWRTALLVPQRFFRWKTWQKLGFVLGLLGAWAAFVAFTGR